MAQSNNIITTSLPSYVQENREVLVDDIVLRGPTISRMAKQTGVKKSAYLNYLDVAPVFQPGGVCGFTPQGDVTLTEKTIDVAVIKINLDVCPENLRGTFAEYLIRTRAGEQPLPYEAEIVNGIKKFIQEALEKAIWQGDTDSLDDNLSNFDGLIKLANAAVTAHTATGVTLTGITSAYQAIDTMIQNSPAAAKKKGLVINVGPEVFENYLRELVSLNLFHYSGPQDEAPIQWIHPGTNVKVMNVEGLAGTSYMLATYDRNMVYGTDLENDMEDFSIVYDEKEEQFHIKVKWASGVQFAYDDRVAIGNAADLVAAPAPGAALSAIAVGVSTIATKAAGLDNLAGIKTAVESSAASNSALAGVIDTDNDAIKTLAVTPTP
ncbi:MAG: hypothetical protein K6A62_04700 [Bacteroidales bacterium]|nr:hypothetical protein [Bacteroidales bacterium]